MFGDGLCHHSDGRILQVEASCSLLVLFCEASVTLPFEGCGKESHQAMGFKSPDTTQKKKIKKPKETGGEEKEN